MRRLTWLLLAGLGMLAWAWVSMPVSAQKAKEAPKGATVVEIDGLKSTTPADWRKEKPTIIVGGKIVPNLLRSHQFRLDRHKDDMEDAEVSILKDLNGAADVNIARWKKSFVLPEGKKLEDVGKVSAAQAGKVKMVILDLQGTYLWKERPQASDDTAKPKPDYRMIAVYFETPDGPHKFQLLGPSKTVEQYRKGFDDWLRGFK